jgi:hypothetical protein
MEAGPQASGVGGQEEDADYYGGTEAEPEGIGAGGQEAEDDSSKKEEADLEARGCGKQVADQDYRKKDALKGRGNWKDGNNNAAGNNNNTIRKYCIYFHFSADGCQRGQFCTFAHSEEDVGMEWVDRRKKCAEEECPMVLCKFFMQGTVFV